jgi:hypothetical protein
MALARGKPLGVIPAELLVFDGHPYVTAAQWEAAYDVWSDRREAWAARHPLVRLPPERIDGGCPFDWEALGIGPNESVIDRRVVPRGTSAEVARPYLVPSRRPPRPRNG